jgi:mono/diheme cytochrome c family protein
VQVVDVAAANRGRTVYIAECLTCHGPKARGKDDNPDLIRSVVVLHDRYTSTIGPFLKKGHTMQSGRSSSVLTVAEVSDLTHFLHQRVADTLRSGPYSKVIDVLVGDAKAGQLYFDATCKSCHSATGDLAHIAARFDPPSLQQRFLFPRSGGFVRGSKTAAVTVTVTPANGAPINGSLILADDFNVSLRDASGQYHDFARTPSLKVEIHDPYDIHNQLLDKYTDRDIHNVVAYLATLK